MQRAVEVPRTKQAVFAATQTIAPVSIGRLQSQSCNIGHDINIGHDMPRAAQKRDLADIAHGGLQTSPC